MWAKFGGHKDMKSFTKNNISKSIILKCLPRKKRMKVYSKLLSGMIVQKVYIIEIELVNNLIKITHKGSEFGLSKLKKTNQNNKLSGEGKKTLVGNERIGYRFYEGNNEWSIKLNDYDSTFTKVYTITKEVNYQASEIMDEVISLMLQNKYSREDSAHVWKYMSEIITNIVYNTNIDLSNKLTIVKVLRAM